MSKKTGMLYLGIDIGTTNCKMGLFDGDWNTVALRSVRNTTIVDEGGARVYSSRMLWNNIRDLLEQILLEGIPVSIGITGMAESGLLLNKNTGEPVTDIIPWSDKRSAVFAKRLDHEDTNRERFFKSGLHNNYKHGIYKILLERELRTLDLKDMIWLCTESYILLKLTGSFAIDPTLALRTYAYDMEKRVWDAEFLAQLGFPVSLMPPVIPSGHPGGCLKKEFLPDSGKDLSVPVSVCGHDHVCASISVGVMSEGDTFLSLGTTGTILGCLKKRSLTEEDYMSGFSYGLSCLPDLMCWQGGLQAFGSSLDWCKNIIGLQSAGYEEFGAFIRDSNNDIGDLLYYPYINGAGMPHFNASAKGAFLGLSVNHTQQDLARAVVEGLAFETKLILGHEGLFRHKGIINAVGGSTRNDFMMQVLSNVLGEEISVPETEEAAVCGAAMLPSVTADGLFAEKRIRTAARKRYMPDMNEFVRYNEKFTKKYMPYRQEVAAF